MPISQEQRRRRRRSKQQKISEDRSRVSAGCIPAMPLIDRDIRERALLCPVNKRPSLLVNRPIFLFGVGFW